MPFSDNSVRQLQPQLFDHPAASNIRGSIKTLIDAETDLRSTNQLPKLHYHRWLLGKSQSDYEQKLEEQELAFTIAPVLAGKISKTGWKELLRKPSIEEFERHSNNPELLSTARRELLEQFKKHGSINEWDIFETLHDYRQRAEANGLTTKEQLDALYEIRRALTAESPHLHPKQRLARAKELLSNYAYVTRIPQF